MERSKQSRKDVHLENVRFAKETQATYEERKSVFPSVCGMHFQRCLPTYFVDAKHQQSATEKAYDVTLLLLSCTNVRGAHCPHRMP